MTSAATDDDAEKGARERRAMMSHARTITRSNGECTCLRRADDRESEAGALQSGDVLRRAADTFLS